MGGGGGAWQRQRTFCSPWYPPSLDHTLSLLSQSIPSTDRRILQVINQAGCSCLPEVKYRFDNCWRNPKFDHEDGKLARAITAASTPSRNRIACDVQILLHLLPLSFCILGSEWRSDRAKAHMGLHFLRSSHSYSIYLFYFLHWL